MTAPKVHPMLEGFFPRAKPETTVTPLVAVSPALVPTDDQRFIDSALRRWQPKMRRTGGRWEILVPAVHTPDRIEHQYVGEQGATLAETIHAMEAAFEKRAAALRETVS